MHIRDKLKSSDKSTMFRDRQSDSLSLYLYLQCRYTLTKNVVGQVKKKKKKMKRPQCNAKFVYEVQMPVLTLIF